MWHADDMEIDLSDVAVRPATTQDARAIAQVQVESWREAYAGILPPAYLAELSTDQRTAMWQRALESAAADVWFATLPTQTLLGFLALRPSPDSDAGPRDHEVSAMYVAPQVWGHGVGRSLMRRALASVSEADGVLLWVLEENTRAQHFYRRHGFVLDGAERTETFDGTEVLELRMRRRKHGTF